MIGSPITLNVDIPGLAIQRHHTATHILHWALREVLGDHVRQAGSLVEDDRLRFDFSHYEGVSTEQLQTIERVANEKLLQNDKVETYEIPFSEKPDGVIAFFGDKYGEFVRVVDLGGWSQGTLRRNSCPVYEKLALFVYFPNLPSLLGTRRLEAVAGISAYEWVSNRVNDYHQVSQKLGCQPNGASNGLNN